MKTMTSLLSRKRILMASFMMAIGWVNLNPGVAISDEVSAKPNEIQKDKEELKNINQEITLDKKKIGEDREKRNADKRQIQEARKKLHEDKKAGLPPQQLSQDKIAIDSARKQKTIDQNTLNSDKQELAKDRTEKRKLRKDLHADRKDRHENHRNPSHDQHRK